jgi:hypothetical protein
LSRHEKLFRQREQSGWAGCTGCTLLVRFMRILGNNQQRITGVEIEHRTHNDTGETSLLALQPYRPLGGEVFVPAQSSRPAEDAVPHITEVLRK